MQFDSTAEGPTRRCAVKIPDLFQSSRQRECWSEGSWEWLYQKAKICAAAVICVMAVVNKAGFVDYFRKRLIIAMMEYQINLKPP